MSEVLTPSRRAQSIEPTLIRALRAGMTATTIDFGLGQSDLNMTEEVRTHLRARLDKPLRSPYTPNAGLDEARRAVADHAGVNAEQVLLTCGVQQGLAVAILGLCDPGDEVLVPDPGFPAYDNLVRAADAEPVAYSLRAPEPGAAGWALDPTAIAEGLTSKTRLVILNNPSNPMGSVHDPRALREVLEILSERGIGWVSDEIYEDYIWEGEFISALSVGDGTPQGIVLSGLSKSHHLMGWRLGWMIGPAESLRALTPLHQHMVTCAPRPAQEALIPALAHHDRAMAATREVFAYRRELALDAMEDLGLGSPACADGAFYLFIDVRPWLSTFDTTAQLAEALLREEDVLVIPGEGFGEGGLGHLRIAYTIGGDELKVGLQRLRKFLQRHRLRNGD